MAERIVTYSVRFWLTLRYANAWVAAYFDAQRFLKEASMRRYEFHQHSEEERKIRRVNLIKSTQVLAPTVQCLLYHTHAPVGVDWHTGSAAVALLVNVE